MTMIEQEARPRCTADYQDETAGEQEQCQNSGSFLILNAKGVRDAEEKGRLDIRVWCTAHARIAREEGSIVEEYRWPNLLEVWRETEPDWVEEVEAKIRRHAVAWNYDPADPDEDFTDEQEKAIDEGLDVIRAILKKARAERQQQ